MSGDPGIPTPRYGDFPAIFWDLDPEAQVQIHDPVIMARLLMEGSLDDIARLLPMGLLDRNLDALVVPDHVRSFWRRVLRGAPDVDRPSTAAG